MNNWQKAVWNMSKKAKSKEGSRKKGAKRNTRKLRSNRRYFLKQSLEPRILFDASIGIAQDVVNKVLNPTQLRKAA